MVTLKTITTYNVNIEFAILKNNMLNSGWIAHTHHNQNGYQGFVNDFNSPWDGSNHTQTSDAPNTITQEVDIDLSLGPVWVGAIHHSPIATLLPHTTVFQDGKKILEIEIIAPDSHTHTGWLYDHIHQFGGDPKGSPTYLEKLDSMDQYTKSQYIPRYRR